jgi:alanine racemase
MSDGRYRSWVEVSRSRIAANYHAVRALAGEGIDVMPVVKADAYRHGAIEVSRVLTGEGARWLAVSNVEEGVSLRRAGIEARILVMADFLPFERAALAEYRLTPVIHTLEDVAAAPVAYHLKIDSGMGRLGTCATVEEIAAAVRATPAPIEGLMSHFASASDYNSAQSDEQTAYFLGIARRLETEGIRPAYRHMASTIAIAYGRRESWGNLLRPGHAIYGYVSPVRAPGVNQPRRLLDVAPALSWKATILAVKDVPAGARIGYGAMFTAPKPMRIGVLAAGYADGVPHRISNRGSVIAGGRLAPILGAVSMDLTTIDLTQSRELRPGDAVTLLGREGDVSIDAQQMARTAGTISYSLLCGIHARVHRVYVD